MDSLVKLKLDNNKIWKIQNLDHLVNLQWLGAPPCPALPPPSRAARAARRRAALL